MSGLFPPAFSFLSCTLTTLLLHACFGVQATTIVSFDEQPPTSATQNVVRDNFIGISYELASYDTLWGKTASTVPAAVQNYMSNLNARMSNPLRIRVGGNAMDGSTYVPNKTDEMLILIDPEAYFNDIPVEFGPILFDVMNMMADKAGEMEFVIGLSMRDPQNDTNVVTLAKDAHDKLGNRLDALLLGNEPDLYAGHGNRQDYNISVYIPEIGQVLDDLKKQGILEKPLIGGPTICCGWDLADVIEAGLDRYDYKYYTLQHYPNHACAGLNERNTNVSSYASHSNLNDYIGWNDRGINLAVTDNVPVILTEYNSVSCGGSNISDLFVMSLWGIDAGLKAISRNFSAVYLHTREYGIQYNLFDPPTDPSLNDSSQSPGWKTGSTYYAALFLSEVGSPSGSVVIDLNLNNSIDNPSSLVAGYGIYSANPTYGFTRDKLVFLNYADGSNPTYPNNGSGYFFSTTESTQTFKIPENTATKVSYRILTAESLFSTTNTSAGGSTDAIKWAGQWIGDLGNLRGQRETHLMECNKGCDIVVPSPGAAIVILTDDDSFYMGNSTVVSSLEDSSSSLDTTIVDSAGLGNGAMGSLQLSVVKLYPLWLGVALVLMMTA
ncbi:hypothetical protein K435DRAFT_757342 [Dendrothele bispora CBS 962.96]|uniref:Beta-glucuronidase C-terminal domain-containing protein n=1 Tax=Dendrothele bispora (strain CBS 962.96) TaxID=1314807 RepID=A0A4S8LVE1_DENBC|nr:hypothetical protein K435DRAFT_757342 [Dendrothele bispora CBS 962.96]